MDTVRAPNRALSGRSFHPAGPCLPHREKVIPIMTNAVHPATRRGTQPEGQVLTVLLTSVAYFMVALDTLVVVTALPSIHRDLGGNVGTLQWTVNAYVLAFGAGIITAAALGDLIGRRRMYLLGLTLFTAASAACALAPDIAGPDRLPRRRGHRRRDHHAPRPDAADLGLPGRAARRRVGIWGGVAGLAVASGPLIGGAVTQGLNWHWIFWVNVPIGILAIAGARLRLADSRGPAARLDLPALVLIAAGVGALTWGLVQAGQAGWGSTRPWPGCRRRRGDLGLPRLGAARRRADDPARAVPVRAASPRRSPPSS